MALYVLFITALDPSKSKFQQMSLLESMTDLEANNGDTVISLGFELGCGPTKKDKTEQNLRRKQSLANDNTISAFMKIKKITHTHTHTRAHIQMH